MKKILTLTLACLTAIFAHAADSIQLTGKRIKIDDALFTGCFHNAFEGDVLKTDDGKLKRGRQGIKRTKGVLYGKGSIYNTMSFKFDMDQVPSEKVSLVMRGIEDRFLQRNVLQVRLNGKQVGKGDYFQDNEFHHFKNPRYFIGWKDVSLEIPAKYFNQKGNVLEIENTSSVLESPRWIYAIIDHVDFEFAKSVTLSSVKRESPLYYYGLDKGIETNIWPTINHDKKICLIKDGQLAFNFFHTIPKSLVGKKGAELTLNVETDADIQIREWKGEIFEKKSVGGKTLHVLKKHFQVARLHETPHPAKGIFTFINTSKSFEGKTLRAWYSSPGVNHQVKEYQLRSVAIDKVEDREELDFRLSIWGGMTPEVENEKDAYVKMIHKAGYNHMFTGNLPELNDKLRKKGFRVTPRFGWFGGTLKRMPEYEKHRAISPNGKINREYCPIEILEHWQGHPVLSRFFNTADEYSKLKDVDGICADYEMSSVWCYCHQCMGAFQKDTGIRFNDRSDLHGEGRYAHEYRMFGRRMNRKLMTKLRDIMKKNNPGLKYISLASACDVPYYWYDGRTNGRFAVKELVKFADEIYISAYCYGLSGGLKSIRPLLKTSEGYAVAEGRKVDIGFISPLGTTISETPRYRGLKLRPEEMRLMILLAGTAGSKGISFFRGDVYDGTHLLATQKAARELIAMREFIQAKYDRSFEVDIRPAGKVERKLDLSGANNFLSRTEWHSGISYQMEAVQLLKDLRGLERVVLLFNYSEIPMDYSVTIRGLYDDEFEATDFMSGEKIGLVSKIDLERGKVQWKVPARDVKIIRLKKVQDLRNVTVTH